ncbi:Methyltransferase domain-containing protein [Chitinophaga costaii]|uniref:Methyltransferase domain-containing protein n=1 Tax=Chitinophaga costaii TaxID=1335309 RepID=A0A1C4EH87_9BACT|nr:methyltransferase domain-containing protein [Chitinophaga costaii]SCC42996.1 Methyltransferase domain-containing protein [Chitinophaga costaii]
MRLSAAIQLLDHPALRSIIATSPVCWADLGCGEGLFTEALAHLLPRRSAVYGVDLRPKLHSDVVNGVSLIPFYADFIRMPLPTEVDGFLLANALHYVEDKPAFFGTLTTYYRNSPQKGPLLIVEYDTDRPVEQWVPWPVSFASLRPLLQAAGWASVQQLGTVQSVYGGTMYAALALP